MDLRGTSGQKRLILPCFASFFAFRPGDRAVGQKENDQAFLRMSLFCKDLRKDTWPKLPMEDNGLEPMTFWLLAKGRLLSNNCETPYFVESNAFRIFVKRYFSLSITHFVFQRLCVMTFF